MKNKCNITKRDLKLRTGVMKRALTKINRSNLKYYNHDNIGVQLDVIDAEVKELQENLNRCK